MSDHSSRQASSDIFLSGEDGDQYYGFVKILLTGGCGYLGSVLTPKLLSRDFHVTVVDTQWFGNFLAPHPRLTVIRGDVRDIPSMALPPADAIVHLANVASEAASDVFPLLSWDINVFAMVQLLEWATRSGVRQFLYASSGSVYGLSDEERVTENVALHPLTIYNKTKVVAERILLSYERALAIQCIRPASICGVSPRMRTDLLVNALTMHALERGSITVLGGEQSRPMVHIEDLANVFLFFLEHENLRGIYNAGFENFTVQEVADAVRAIVPVEIVRKQSPDPRSYRMCSNKLLAAGFMPQRTFRHAVGEIVDAYRHRALRDDDRFSNVQWMRQLFPAPAS
jgi:nucleoside-diphosphate-sugar epimerase